MRVAVRKAIKSKIRAGRLVQIQTKLRNIVQALALNHQLRLGPRLWSKRGQQQLSALPLDNRDALQREHSAALLQEIRTRIRAVEKELTLRADQDAPVRLLRTHPGVGLLTSLAVVHTLEPVARFERARRIAAYCGLDPREASSGATVRIGDISKRRQSAPVSGDGSSASSRTWQRRS